MANQIFTVSKSGAMPEVHCTLLANPVIGGTKVRLRGVNNGDVTMELPENVIKSRLYGVLGSDTELVSVLKSVRYVVSELAATTSRTVPNYTDHTVRHMDALWKVADEIITTDEVNSLTPAEVFLLGVGFYLHDIGMAYAATTEGLAKVKSSEPFRAFMSSLPQESRNRPDLIAVGVAISIRRLHAEAARELGSNEIPGSGGQYIFQAKTDREAWGETCGEIAASHHWSINQLESSFGPLSDAPLPGGRKADFLYVSSCLRLIDYAHINRERASTLARAFRPPLEAENVIHWYAQEHIDGPLRANDYIVYRSAKPIEDVDAWWLFYEMMNGLDTEIRGVTRVLDRRLSTYKRLSIRGVKGADSPEAAITLIPPKGFLPLEVNLRAGSIDKLVELLAGETLYGPNPMAAIRELIQNARDAVMLKREVATGALDKVSLSLPITVALTTTGDSPTLEITDHGIGMTKLVMTDYLIAIASNYWTTQFSNDFPDLASKGFKSAGKFGIGFLSVFMIGDDVVVETNRLDEDRYRLSLRGVGRRGVLQDLKGQGGSGTSVRIKIKPGIIDRISNLDELVKSYAPTLPHDLKIIVDKKEMLLPSGWLANISCEEFQNWTTNTTRLLNQQASMRPGDELSSIRSLLIREQSLMWRLKRARDDSTNPWKVGWPEFVDGKTRLIASLYGFSILSLRGLAIQPIPTAGFAGVIELDSFAPDVSRGRVLNADVEEIIRLATNAVRPGIVNNLNEIGKSTFIGDAIGFIANCVDLYGKRVIQDSDVLWISQMKMPGHVELIDCATFLARTTEAKSVFLAFDLGPWTAMKKWVETGNKKDNDEIAIVLDDDGQQGPGYVTEKGYNYGSLNAIWKKCLDSSLFGTLVDIVAQAWQVSPSVLLEQQGWSHQQSHIYGRFIRE